MDELHTVIADFLQRHRTGSTSRRRPADIRPTTLREPAIYARVAGMAPADMASLSAQVAACRGSSRGMPIELVFVDTAAGPGLDRPHLAELRTAIAFGRISAVLVASTDHLTPDQRLLLALRTEWAAAGVTIVVAGGP